jgi:deoxyribose-phosphate aldolase
VATSQGDQNTHNNIIHQELPYIKALAKTHGVDVVKTSTGYRVFKWGLYKELSTLSELESFLALMGVKL